jgi:tRNA-Thr(GGU) m(6)t(6)A37 methyltransferase TsaA
VITFRAIGYVENEFNEPVSQDTLRAAVSRIVLEPALAEGLQGLAPGSKILVIFNFHLAEGFGLLQYPRGDESRPKRGVFALRSPYRPNGIGVSEVELLAINGNVLSVRGLDAINWTPVLDIKPADGAR